MDENNPKPDPKPAGKRPPPRPPNGTVVGIDPEDDDPKKKRRMTIAKSAQGEGKFIRHSGGRDHYGHVILRIDPSGKDQGIEVRYQIVENSIPTEFIKAVGDEIFDILQIGFDDGPIANLVITDVVITVVGGSSHKVDSNALAYKMATIFALIDALKKAGPIPLE